MNDRFSYENKVIHLMHLIQSMFYCLNNQGFTVFRNLFTHQKYYHKSSGHVLSLKSRYLIKRVRIVLKYLVNDHSVT